MPTKTSLRLLIIAEVVLGIGSVVAYYLGETSLPEALRFFESEKFDDTAGPALIIVLGLMVLLLLALIVAWIGLFVFWQPARLLYLVTTVLALLLMPFFGPYVETGLSYTLTEAASIVAGIILALVYFSPLKELYERREPEAV